MRRLAGILGVAVVALLSGCAEDTITPVPSEGTETTEADTQSFQPAQATDDRAFDDARAEAMPLILKAEDELDQVDVPYTLDTSSVAPTIPDLVLIVWWTNLLVVAVGILNLRRDRVGVAGGLFLAAALTVAITVIQQVLLTAPGFGRWQTDLVLVLEIIEGALLALAAVRAIGARAPDALEDKH